MQLGHSPSSPGSTSGSITEAPRDRSLHPVPWPWPGGKPYQTACGAPAGSPGNVLCSMTRTLASEVPPSLPAAAASGASEAGSVLAASAVARRSSRLT